MNRYFLSLLFAAMLIGNNAFAQKLNANKDGQVGETHKKKEEPKKAKSVKKVIDTNNAPAAIGPYSQAIEANGMIFISGQLPIDPSTGDFPAGAIKEQTEQSFKNILAILLEVGLTTENIVKTTVFLSDMSDFVGMNEVYSTYFKSNYPARSTVAVKELPKKALVEIEVIAVR